VRKVWCQHSYFWGNLAIAMPRKMCRGQARTEMVFVFTPWVALIGIEEPECESAFVHQFSKNCRYSEKTVCNQAEIGRVRYRTRRQSHDRFAQENVLACRLEVG